MFLSQSSTVFTGTQDPVHSKAEHALYIRNTSHETLLGMDTRARELQLSVTPAYFLRIWLFFASKSIFTASPKSCHPALLLELHYALSKSCLKKVSDDGLREKRDALLNACTY
ncbi:uncharacterized protein ZBAI_05544 [Zygosaccharomyces bailii ISA1307]|nr:uncharacterized protein ZBAI_05544 [Zygosaccharomyces bailii ISA1307]